MVEHTAVEHTAVEHTAVEHTAVEHTARHVLITGGGGLIGVNVARAVLAADPDCTVELVDLEPTPAIDYLGEPERVQCHAVDLTSSHPLGDVDPARVTEVVHAAALCHVPQWELADVARFVDVNIGATLRVLDWARTLPSLRRIVHVSSGGVYGEPTRWSTTGPQPEEGPYNPPETYAITKLAGEQLARRYAELHGMDLLVVRLSGVFGPMERVTPGRSLMSMAYQIARAIARDSTLTVSPRTLEAGGDFLSALDVGVAMRLLLDCGTPSWRTYNIAYGVFTPARALLDAAAGHVPGFRWQVADRADVEMDPDDRLARWNAYAVDRLHADTGWRPRPFAEQLAEYLDWVAVDGARRAP